MPLSRLCTIFGSPFEGEANHSVMNFEGMGNFISCEKLLPEERSKNCAKSRLCLVQMHTAACYRVTDRLLVTIPDAEKVSILPARTAGRAFFSEWLSPQEEMNDISTIAERCLCMRDKVSKSFVSCLLTNVIGNEEREALETISRVADYLILDGRKTPMAHLGSYIGMMRQISRSIGLYVQAPDGMPCEIASAWIAKAVCEVGPKGVVFIDGSTALVSSVQDELEAHPYSGGCGGIIPIIRNVKVLDMEPIVIESRRAWCSGVCVQEGALDGRFDLWQCAQEMIVKGKSLRSMLALCGEKWVDLAIECLYLERALASGEGILACKARVESLLAKTEVQLVGTGEFEVLQRSIQPLLACANSEANMRRPAIAASRIV